MDVVRPAQPVPTLERFQDAATLEDRRRYGEADEGQPRDRRQDVYEDEHGNRQEDDHADEEGPDQPAALDTSPGNDHRRAHEREGHERDAYGEADDPLRLAMQRGQECAEDADRRAQSERGPEPPPVQPDGLGYDLPNRPGFRRKGRRERLLGLPGHDATVAA